LVIPSDLLLIIDYLPFTNLGRLALSIWPLFAGGEKNGASIIRATCTFDAKKVLKYRFVILVTRFGTLS